MHGLRPLLTAALVAVALLATACTSDEPQAAPSASPSEQSSADLVEVGLSLLQQDQDEAALTAFQEAAEKDPDNYLAHYNVGVVLQQRGDDPGALAAYGRSVAAKGDYVPALFNQATIQAKTNPTVAAQTYRRIIQLQPTAPTAYFNLGLIEAQLGQLQQARQHLDTAVKQDASLLAKIPPDVAQKVRAGTRATTPAG